MALPQINRNKTGGWVLIGGAALCTLIVLHEVFALVQAVQAKNWPVVTGTIVDSRAVIGCGKGSSYYPFVRYRYEYDARAYEGHRIAFGNVGCGSEQNARRFASSYPAGQSVRVWVRPSSPSESTLTASNVRSESWGVMAVLSVVIAGGFVIGRSLLRQESAA
jgi:hypothetical protein